MPRFWHEKQVIGIIGLGETLAVGGFSAPGLLNFSPIALINSVASGHASS